MPLTSRCLLLAVLTALVLLPASPAAADDERITVDKSGDSGLSVGGSTTTTITPPSAPGGGGGDGSSGAGGGGGGTPSGPTAEELRDQICAKDPASMACQNAITKSLACYLSRASCPTTEEAQAPAPDTPPQAQPITITATDVQRLLVNGSGLTRQPPRPQAIVTKPVIAYTSDSPQTLTTTVNNTPITVIATPTTYHWDWGDSTTQTTTHPGAPWPNHTIHHTYTTTATAVTITLTTTWTATWTHPDGTTHTVDGTLTTTETTPPFDLVRTTTYLTDDAEQAQGR